MSNIALVHSQRYTKGYVFWLVQLMLCVMTLHNFSPFVRLNVILEDLTNKLISCQLFYGTRTSRYWPGNHTCCTWASPGADRTPSNLQHTSGYTRISANVMTPSNLQHTSGYTRISVNVMTPSNLQHTIGYTRISANVMCFIMQQRFREQSTLVHYKTEHRECCVSQNDANRF